MEFRNLTPFEALAYSALNVHDEEHHVVVVRVPYRLVPDGAPGLFRCELAAGDEALAPLRMEDVYEGDVNASSVREESDIAPFKPRCDVVLRATAWAPGGVAHERWAVQLRVTAPDPPHPSSEPDAPRGVLIDKTLEVCGPRSFLRDGDRWTLGAATPTMAVPLRWERAFGGRCVVPRPDAPGEHLLNEVCFTNPLGAGWVEARYLDACAQATGHAPEALAAPQVEHPDDRVAGLVVTQHPPHAVEAPQMASLAAEYGHRPAGFGFVGRPWTPRLQRAGTYDEHWAAARHPFLPDDFSFRYWNGAPDDQQIAFPPLGLRFELLNLLPPTDTHQGYAAFSLPMHRCFVMAWLRGLPMPVPAVVDTVIVDAEAMTVTCLWRVLVARAPGFEVMEARFETDPDAHLLKLEVGRG